MHNESARDPDLLQPTQQAKGNGESRVTQRPYYAGDLCWAGFWLPKPDQSGRRLRWATAKPQNTRHVFQKTLPQPRRQQNRYVSGGRGLASVGPTTGMCQLCADTAAFTVETRGGFKRIRVIPATREGRKTSHAKKLHTRRIV